MLKTYLIQTRCSLQACDVISEDCFRIIQNSRSRLQSFCVHRIGAGSGGTGEGGVTEIKVFDIVGLQKY